MANLLDTDQPRTNRSNNRHGWIHRMQKKWRIFVMELSEHKLVSHAMNRFDVGGVSGIEFQLGAQ
jgi:hypothetical protein